MNFNNFLTGILGNLSLARLDIQPGNMLDRTLDEIGKAAIRAKDLTLQLLTFSNTPQGGIVSSGYSNDSVMANFANFGFRAAVKKPYQMREMSLVLNEVLKG
jgi:signal transduction histidine kinase